MNVVELIICDERTLCAAVKILRAQGKTHVVLPHKTYHEILAEHKYVFVSFIKSLEKQPHLAFAHRGLSWECDRRGIPNNINVVIPVWPEKLDPK